MRITMSSLRGGSASVKHAGESRGHILADIEEDDLFEIDLDAVDSVPLLKYSWDSYFTAAGDDHTAAGDVLLANCLLPVTDISRAIPTVSGALSYKTGANAAMIPEPVPLGQLLRLPFLEAYGLHQKKVKPQRHSDRRNETRLDLGLSRSRRPSNFDSLSEDIAIFGG